MSKKIIKLALCALLLALSDPVKAQQPKKIPRIGFLLATFASVQESRLEAFRQGLRDLGYIEGHNITIEYRWAEGKLDRLPDLAALSATPGLLSQRTQVVELAAKNRLPTVYHRREFVEAGGLMTYCVSNTDLARRATVYVDKILKGAQPADLPVEQPMKFELLINLKAAKQIGLTIPPNVLVRADRVIK
jgi:ABC-type uncharacterized transport system substrate-binding protein